MRVLCRASVNGSAGSHSDRCDDPIARATERIVEWQVLNPQPSQPLHLGLGALDALVGAEFQRRSPPP